MKMSDFFGYVYFDTSGQRLGKVLTNLLFLSKEINMATHLLDCYGKDHWRDINKGDNERVEVRSRLVAREINRKGPTGTSQEHHHWHLCVT